ncbi:MAG: hypothetical protein P8K08_25880 [Fuerstiella sp.]|nr:hypothetical protein [Fuerstiella sp.]
MPNATPKLAGTDAVNGILLKAYGTLLSKPTSSEKRCPEKSKSVGNVSPVSSQQIQMP